jgi:hypothetical protein
MRTASSHLSLFSNAHKRQKYTHKESNVTDTWSFIQFFAKKTLTSGSAGEQSETESETTCARHSQRWFHFRKYFFILSRLALVQGSSWAREGGMKNVNVIIKKKYWYVVSGGLGADERH